MSKIRTIVVVLFIIGIIGIALWIMNARTLHTPTQDTSGLSYEDGMLASAS